MYRGIVAPHFFLPSARAATLRHVVSDATFSRGAAQQSTVRAQISLAALTHEMFSSELLLYLRLSYIGLPER